MASTEKFVAKLKEESQRAARIVDDMRTSVGSSSSSIDTDNFYCDQNVLPETKSNNLIFPRVNKKREY